MGLYSILQKLQIEKSNFQKIVLQLDTLSPLKTLTRGYCVTESDGKIVSKVKDLKKDMEISLKFQDGNAKAKVL